MIDAMCPSQLEDLSQEPPGTSPVSYIERVEVPADSVMWAEAAGNAGYTNRFRFGAGVGLGHSENAAGGVEQQRLGEPFEAVRFDG